MGNLYLFGRRVIESPVAVIDASNVIDELEKALQVHAANQRDIEYLFGYVRGKQPILQRTKDVRPEICNKVAANHAYEILSFKKGHVFGDAVQYVKRGEGSSDGINILNDLMLLEEKSAQDLVLADDYFTCGVAYRMALPGGQAFEIDVLDPRYTFVVYNSGFKKRPLMGVTFSKDIDGNNQYSVYTPQIYFLIKETPSGLAIDTQKGNAVGMIPIIEYAAPQRMGAFEPAIPLLDAINSVLSNRLDGLEQHVQSFLKFINCDIDLETFKKLKMEGAIKVTSVDGMNADVDLITSELSQSETQVLVDSIYSAALIICGVPNRHGATKSTSDTGQAVMLRDGWGDAESRAREVELLFKKSEREFLKVILRIIDGMGPFRGQKLKSLKLEDIEIKFTRNRTDNFLVKTQGLQNLVESNVVHPRIALRTCGLFSDPEIVWEESEEWCEKYFSPSKQTPANNKPNPKEGGWVDRG